MKQLIADVHLVAEKMTSYLVKNRTFFIVAVALGACYFIWWLAYYPGTFSPDSIDQLKQAIGLDFVNASPFTYSLILSFFVHVFGTPSPMGLLQATVLIVTAAITLNIAAKRGVSKRIIFLYVLLLVILPYIGIFNVTIWKDVLYSNVVLAAMLLTFTLFISQKARDSWLCLFLLSSLVALIPLLRFNGIVFFVLIPVVIFLAKLYPLKRFITLLLSELTVYFFVAIILAGLFHVANAPLIQEGIYIKLAGAVLNHNDANITGEERSIFYRVLPSEDWENYYTCETVDYLFLNGLQKHKGLYIENTIDPDPVFVSLWHKAVLTASLRNPMPILRDKACVVQYLLGVKATYYKYEIGVFKESGGEIYVNADSKAPLIKKFLNKYLFIMSAGSVDGVNPSFGLAGRLLGYILWTAIVPLAITVGYWFISLKRKMRGVFIYTTISLINVLATVILMPATNFRYIYPLFLMTLFLPIIYLLELGTLPSSAKK